MATFNGTEGNDSLFGGATADELNGFGGNDFLQGGDGVDTVLGGAGNDTMSGNAGNDWVRGGTGNDQVSGGGGQDSFAFADFGTTNADVLTDFASTWDNIHLDLSAFTALGSTGRFVSGDARFRLGTAAQDADDRIIYNQTTGQLWYDADGSGAGAAQLIATLSNRSAMTATDIHVFQSATPPPSGQTINGTSGNDSLTGGTGNDTINGHGGNDTLNGQGGADQYVLSSPAGGPDADVIAGFASGTDKIVLDGSVLANLGASGNFSATDARFYAGDFFGFSGWAHDGTDRIIYDTSTGNVWYDADGTAEGATWAGAWPLLIATLEGAPSVSASDFVVINGNSTAGVSRDGTAGDDSLVGTAGDDVLAGLEGNDTLVGLAGNDVLDDGDGSDSMLGGDGNDTLHGGTEYFFDAETSVDTMDGGLGNDTYVLGREVAMAPWWDSSHLVVLRDAGGVDTIIARSGYWTLGAGFENLEIFNGYGEGGMLGIGNSLDNLIVSHSEWYVWGTLDGGDGNDTLIGGAGRDTFQFQAGSGNYGNDFVDGGGDEDTLDFTGARSAVTIDFRTGTATGGGTGGTGSVTFVNVDFAHGGDFNDTIIAPDRIVDHRWGDPLGPVLFGGGGNDTLLGGSEVDFLYGDAGDDELRGGGSADIITGGSGNDRMFGDEGDDQFNISVNYWEPGPRGFGNDTVSGGAGIDTITYGFAESRIIADFTTGTITGGDADGAGSVSFSGIENLSGTDWGDQITGDAGANWLDGNGGADTIAGGGGNDTIYGDQFYSGPWTVSYLSGGDGDDQVFAGFGADRLEGGAGNDLLQGSDGRDTLTGGAGQDTLYGGWHSDRFVFDVAPGAANADVIADFDYGGLQDSIYLDVRAMTALGASGAFGSSDARFHVGTAAHDGDDRVIYDASTGSLYYDADGNGGGAAQLIATLQGAPALAAADIVVYDSAAPAGEQIDGTAGDDTLIGSPSADTINGLGGDDYIDGAGGNDRIDGGDGNDRIYTGTGNDTLIGGVGFDGFYLLNGSLTTYGQDVIIGGDWSDTLIIGEGATVGIVADLAAGSLSGGSAGSSATISGVEYVHGTRFADRMTGDGADNYFIGFDGNDTLSGAGGDDILDGGGGADLLTGGDGNDNLYAAFDGSVDTVDGGLGNDFFSIDPGDVVTDAGGIDTISVGASWTLAAGFEHLNVASSDETSVLRGTGNSASNQITGWSPAGTILSGLDGNDTLWGSTSNDTLLGGNGGDLLLSEGGSDVLDGGAGMDTVDAGFGIATIVFGASPGSANADLIQNFHAEWDMLRLDGNAMGAIGPSGQFAAGDARFWTGAAAHDSDDRVVYNNVTGELWYDADGSGAAAAQLLATLQGAPALVATDIWVVNGTSGVVVNGTSGNDSLVGGTGNDTLNGFGGNDTLDGGAGADSMVGGTGDDLYLVDNTGDQVVEAQNGGIDEVRSSLQHYTLADWVNNLTLLNGAITGSGNEIENVLRADGLTYGVQLDGHGGGDTLIGGSGGDELNGWAGNDSMVGGAGNDTFDGFNHPQDGNDTMDGGAGDDSFYVRPGDVIMDSSGTDTVFAQTSWTLASGLENLTFWNSFNDEGIFGLVGTGNELNNVMDGRGGDGVTLDGRAGNDTLIGSIDADSFLFTVAPGSANADTITSFGSGVDKIRLDGNAMTAIGPSGNFAAGDARFWTGPAAHDADDRVIFDSASGRLWYDADGTGAATAQLIATVSGSVVATDIAVDNGSVTPPPADGTNGTEGNDTMLGTAASDTLNGLGGNDFMQGNGSADTLRGGAGNDTIGGNEGTDWLEGGAGNDRIAGGSSQDAFVFREFGAANADTLTDFSGNGWETLRFDNSAFAALGADGRFVSGDGRFRAGTAAADADDRIIYNSATAQVWYDADGNGAGAAQLVATLPAGAPLVATDIWVI